MSNQFTEPSISGYNDTPPSDDGANTSANEITWAKHKTKLTDPLKNYVDSVVSNVTSAFAKNLLAATSAKSSGYSVVTGDRGKLFLCTNSITLDLLACATAGDGFSFAVRNDGSGTITLDGNSSETINGSATQTLYAGETAILGTDASEWYMVVGRNTSQLAPETGYVRLSPNYCKKSNIGSFATITTATETTVTSPSSNATAIEIELYARSYNAGSATTRYATAIVHTTTSASTTTAQGQCVAQHYEESGETTGFPGCYSVAIIVCQAASAGDDIYITTTFDAGTNSGVGYRITGYYD